MLIFFEIVDFKFVVAPTKPGIKFVNRSFLKVTQFSELWLVDSWQKLICNDVTWNVNKCKMLQFITIYTSYYPNYET